MILKSQIWKIKIWGLNLLCLMVKNHNTVVVVGHSIKSCSVLEFLSRIPYSIREGGGHWALDYREVILKSQIWKIKKWGLNLLCVMVKNHNTVVVVGHSI